MILTKNFLRIKFISSAVIFGLLLFTSSVIVSQNRQYTIGGGLGVGSLMGDFPSQSTFGTKLFIETTSPFSVFSEIQFNFTFAQKLEKFLPGSYSYDHYSYFTSLGLAGIFKQNVNSKIFIKEGIGFIYLNDRSFNDINSWNYGILISLLGGIHLSNDFDLFLDLDYGITMNKTNASYLIFLFGSNYNF